MPASSELVGSTARLEIVSESEGAEVEGRGVTLFEEDDAGETVVEVPEVDR